MITTAVTAGISAVLVYFGVDPTLYVAPIWIGVKVLIVGGIGGLMWRRRKTAQD